MERPDVRRFTSNIAQCAFAVGLWDVDGVSDLSGPAPTGPAPFLAPLADWWRSQPPRTRIAAAAAAALLLGLTFVPGLLWLR